MPDVDIDFFDRDGTLKLFKHTPAYNNQGRQDREAQVGRVLPCCARTSCNRAFVVRL